MIYSEIINLDKKVNIKQSLFSGQSFLWNNYNYSNELYVSSIGDIPLIIEQISDTTLHVQSTENTINNLLLSDFIKSYLSLDIDSNCAFINNFSGLYPDLWEIINEYSSLRILRQNPFETMVSFMCAQGIGMHLIRKQVSMLAMGYGNKVSVSVSGREVILYIFPTPEQLAEADPIALSLCTNNNRIRATNIILAAKGVLEGRINFDYLANRELPLSELRNELCKNPGIGFKIADCIALFGLARFDAFPVDTHVKQYLAKWFNSTVALRSLTPVSYLALDAEARTFLNPELAGYAGHILFHCWRSEIKKLRSF